MKPSPKEIEVLAVTLFNISSTGSEQALYGEWRQADPELRNNFREQAKRLVDRLWQSGIRCSARSTKQVDKAFHEIITQPARPAYDLDEELE